MAIEPIAGGRPLEMRMNTKKKGTFAVLLLIVALLIASPINGDARGGGGGHAGGGRGGGSHAGGGHRGGGRVVTVHRGGGGFGWGWRVPLGVVGGIAVLAPYGVPYYPPPAVVASEQSPEDVQSYQQELAYWYYCPNPEGYYPYVKSCPNGWMRVIADANPPDPEGETGP
jgi:hypothetical protein